MVPRNGKYSEVYSFFVCTAGPIYYGPTELTVQPLSYRYDMLCGICQVQICRIRTAAVQIQHKERATLNHADSDTPPTRQHELDHADHTDRTDHTDHTDQEYVYLSALKYVSHQVGN